MIVEVLDQIICQIIEVLRVCKMFRCCKKIKFAFCSRQNDSQEPVPKKPKMIVPRCRLGEHAVVKQT
jgi:hypothetical protein